MNRTHFINIRVKSKEKDLLVKKARKEDVRLSEFLRNILFEKLKEKKN